MLMLLLFSKPVLDQNLLGRNNYTARRHTERVSLISGEDPRRVLGHKDMGMNGAHGSVMKAGPHG